MVSTWLEEGINGVYTFIVFSKKKFPADRLQLFLNDTATSRKGSIISRSIKHKRRRLYCIGFSLASDCDALIAYLEGRGTVYERYDGELPEAYEYA